VHSISSVSQLSGCLCRDWCVADTALAWKQEQNRCSARSIRWKMPVSASCDSILYIQ
jgi:hypothetical protein